MLIGERDYTPLDNTGTLGPFPGGFQRSGLHGLFDMTGTPGFNPDPATGGAPAFDPALITAANAEAVFVVNLWRSIQGQAPLPAQSSAPTVNVGLSADAKNMLTIGGLGLVAFLIARRKHRTRR